MLSPSHTIHSVTGNVRVSKNIHIYPAINSNVSIRPFRQMFNKGAAQMTHPVDDRNTLRPLPKVFVPEPLIENKNSTPLILHGTTYLRRQ